MSEIREAAKKFIEILTDKGYSPQYTGFEVKNFVGSGYMGGNIDLIKLYRKIGGFLEPEIFPGLQYQYENKTLIIFHSGKMIITGAKRQKEIDEIYHKMLPIVQEFLK